MEFYEKGPVTAAVVRIEGKSNIVLNRGTADRIRPGMLLVAEDHNRIELKVISAQAHESVTEVAYYWNSDRRVKKGGKFTSGDSPNRVRGTGFERFSDLPKPRKPQISGNSRSSAGLQCTARGMKIQLLSDLR